MDRLEKEIEKEILAEAGRYNINLWVNNTGALDTPDGRHIRFGLGNSSHDINKRLKFPDRVGILPIKITPDMIGLTVGVFIGVELKREGWNYTGQGREEAQSNAIELIKRKGGIAGFVNSIDSFRKLIGL